MQQLHVFAHLLGMTGILAGKLEINHHQAVALFHYTVRSLGADTAVCCRADDGALVIYFPFRTEPILDLWHVQYLAGNAGHLGFLFFRAEQTFEAQLLQGSLQVIGLFDAGKEIVQETSPVGVVYLILITFGINESRRTVGLPELNVSLLL